MGLVLLFAGAVEMIFAVSISVLAALDRPGTVLFAVLESQELNPLGTDKRLTDHPGLLSIARSKP
jgi:hypothetical protein